VAKATSDVLIERLIDWGRVAVLAGRGHLDARHEVLALGDAAATPIVKPLLGKSVVPDNSPFTTGGIGLLSTAPSQDALAKCDTLVILGSSFPYMEFYPEPGQARAIQVDVDPERIGLRYPADIGLVGNCHDVLRALLPLVEVLVAGLLLGRPRKLFTMG
jgi:pyruvate dehydrogenase (quinone)